MHAPEIAVAGAENEAIKLVPCRKAIPTPEATNHATNPLELKAGAASNARFMASGSTVAEFRTICVKAIATHATTNVP